MNRDEPIRDDELNAYLDGELDAAARQRLEARLQSDQDALRMAELQNRLDQSLQRIFAVPPVPNFSCDLDMPTELKTEPDIDHGDDQIVARQVWWRSISARAIAIGVVAALVWFVVTWQLIRPSGHEPVFARRPLVEIFQEIVQTGFQPYYDCRDPERFAEVFTTRQGHALKLSPLSPGQRMLGLSYPGGLSRNTTAMLCEVDDRPVMVFVDRSTQDDSIAVQNKATDLNVFRKVLGPLVIYEVTPWPEARMLDSLSSLN